jgi:pyruvate formate lyase activating enzyme
MTIGKINSIQSLGALDGPGIRFVVFMQGCNLRCGCCHNPEPWDCDGGEEYTADAILEKAKRFKSYFGSKGGVTVSGGEPLLQAEFVYELFSKCHEAGINTCLDTSGSVLNDMVVKALSVTDRVLLDIKYDNEVDYSNFVGCSIEKPIAFLQILDNMNIPTTLRNVVIPTLNDNENSISFLNDLAAKYNCIDKIELLPFKKICKVKYDDMNLKFRFDHIQEPDREMMQKLNSLINL